MKTPIILTLLAATTALWAQETKPRVVDRGPDSRTWQWETTVKRPDGKIETETHGYVEVGTGVCRWSGKEWIDASEVIEIFEGGAIGRSAQLQVTFAPTYLGGIDTLAPDGNRVQSRILGLAFYDLATQKSVMIAEAKDCVGAVLPPNQVIYRDAFDGNVLADVVYTYKLGSFHQDLVLRAQLPVTPEAYGLSSDSSVLEIWTEMISGREPQKVPQAPVGILKVRNAGPVLELPLADVELNFGHNRIIAGRAFNTEAAVANPFTGDSLPVAKNWVAADLNRKCLVEQVAIGELQNHLAKTLPQAKATTPDQRASVQPRRVFPSAPQHARVSRPAPAMQMAALQQRPGFTIDYELVTTTSNMTFKGDTTFLMMNTLNLVGTTTIEGGTVIKHTNGTTSVYLNILSGNVDCKTTPWLPAVLTSFNDNSVGEVITGSSGTPTMVNGATRLRHQGNTTVHDLRFKYAEYGYVSTSGQQSLTNLQFYQCRYPFYVSSGRYDIHNVLVSDCQSVFYSISSTADLNVEHGTFNRVTNGIINVTNSLLHLTNCLFTSASSNLYFVGESNVVLSSGEGVYQTVGSGEHYLAENSPYRDAGTTNLSAETRNLLKNSTTHPPILLNGPINADLVLSPQASRDAGLPDLGYHYAPLDYLVCAVSVNSNATVLATNGVAIGLDYFGTNSWAWLLAPGKFISQGTPHAMNHLVRAHNVQEKASGNPYTRAWFYDGNTPGGSTSTLRARFTEFGQLANDGYLLYRGVKFDAIELTHSAIYNPSLVVELTGATPLCLGMTNSLWQRGGFMFGTGGATAGTQVDARNNLWRGGYVHYFAGNTNWTLRDELFDNVLWLDDHGAPMTVSHSARFNTAITNFASAGTNLYPLSSLNYTNGPLGDFYLATTETNLINKGSRTADLAQLFHFTTQISQEKETNSPVDIGFHYTAVTNVAGVWQAIDTDGDGVPDYQEDANGNGVWNDGESDWGSITNRTADLTGSISLRTFTPLK